MPNKVFRRGDALTASSQNYAGFAAEKKGIRIHECTQIGQRFDRRFVTPVAFFFLSARSPGGRTAPYVFV